MRAYERFLRYAKINTESAEGTVTSPSTACQWELARLLEGELKELGLQEVRVSEFGVVTAVLPAAATIAVLAAIESLLSCVVADEMTGTKHNSNMELVAQGVGNAASALFGGIPATGAIARTAANIKNGGSSPVAGMVHAAVLLAVVMVALIALLFKAEDIFGKDVEG